MKILYKSFQLLQFTHGAGIFSVQQMSCKISSIAICTDEMVTRCYARFVFYVNKGHGYCLFIRICFLQSKCWVWYERTSQSSLAYSVLELTLCICFHHFALLIHLHLDFSLFLPLSMSLREDHVKRRQHYLAAECVQLGQWRHLQILHFLERNVFFVFLKMLLSMFVFI